MYLNFASFTEMSTLTFGLNIFEKSLMENGDGNPDYISTADYIHPSPTGIIFISKTIADYIYKNNIFPHK